MDFHFEGPDFRSVFGNAAQIFRTVPRFIQQRIFRKPKKQHVLYEFIRTSPNIRSPCLQIVGAREKNGYRALRQSLLNMKALIVPVPAARKLSRDVPGALLFVLETARRHLYPTNSTFTSSHSARRFVYDGYQAVVIVRRS